MLSIRLTLARQVQRWSNPYLLLTFFFLIGGIHGSLQSQPPEDKNHIRQIITVRQEASVIGTVLRSPEAAQDKTSILVDTVQIILSDSRALAVNGLVQIAINGQIDPNIVPGDPIICRAWLAPVSSYGVPGAFNYKKFMENQATWVTGWSKSPLLLKKIKLANNQSIWQTIRFIPEKVRYKINRFISQTLPENQASVYKAILTGDRSGISPAIKEAFRASGATHLLAISGLHIGLLALISTTLLSLILKRSETLLLRFSLIKLAAALSLLPLTAYALVAGFGPPVVRALIMAAVFIAALLFNRQWSIANNIAIAALIILAIDPTAITTASFQLSFSAVIAIALFTPTLQKLITTTEAPPNSSTAQFYQKLKQWGLASLLISILASAGTAPLVLTHFNRLSLISPITTLVIEPVLCFWSLTLGLLGCLLLPFQHLSSLVFQTGALGIDLSIIFAKFLASIPLSSLWSPAPHLAKIFCWYAFLISLSTLQTPKHKALKYASCAICMLGLFAPSSIFTKSPTQMEVAVLDVGQGSAIVFHLPNGKTYLLDGGQKRSGKSNRFDIGEQVIARYLWHKNITRLEGVIISHPDADHFNGLPFIFKEFKPANLWINGFESEIKSRGTNKYRLLLNMAARLKIPTSIPAYGENLFKDTKASLTLVSKNNQSDSASKSGSDNDASMVLRLNYGNNSFLFPSDIERMGEEALIKQSKTLINTDVLIAPHHGSKTSSSQAFLDSVSPDVIVISAGKNATGTFPSAENLAAYKKIGSKVYLTAESGSVFFTTDGTDFQVTTFAEIQAARLQLPPSIFPWTTKEPLPSK